MAAIMFIVCASRADAADAWISPQHGGRAASADKAASPVPALSGSYRPAYGLLWLQIDPEGVAISLDGDYLDKDVWLVSLAPGVHVLRVSKPGFQPRESRFGIAAGQNVRLDVKLLPDSGG
ncbi:MAG: PEGA domain-containing protein [Fibrobacteria bacterium]